MNLVGVYTLIKKELVRFIRVPTQTVGSPVITTLLYFAVFGYSIGSRVGPIDGLPYTEFIMPGLIMMNILMISFTGISSGLMLAKVMGTLSDILVTPLSYLEIILGFTLASVVRSILTAGLIYATALFFIPFRVDHPFYLLTFTTLVAFAFSLAGLVVGVWAENFEQITLIPTFVITPLTFLGGVFYSVQMLPPFFKTISHFNPLLYMINGMRYGFYSSSDVSQWLSFTILMAILIVLTLVTWHLFRIGYKIRT